MFIFMISRFPVSIPMNVDLPTLSQLTCISFKIRHPKRSNGFRPKGSLAFDGRSHSKSPSKVREQAVHLLFTFAANVHTPDYFFTSSGLLFPFPG